MRATRLVVDASVALKWYLEDEQDRVPALEIVKAWNDGRLDVLAPTFFRLELANVLRRATLQKERKLRPEKSRKHLVDFLSMDLKTVDVVRHLRAIYDQALRLRISVYDMSYVFLAARARIDMVTADDRLFNAVKGSKPFVKQLRDYKLPALPPEPSA